MGRWHTKLVWLPSADLVAVRQAAARSAGQVGTRHQGGRQGCGPALEQELYIHIVYILVHLHIHIPTYRHIVLHIKKTHPTKYTYLGLHL